MFQVDLPARQLQQEDESRGFGCSVATAGANGTTQTVPQDGGSQGSSLGGQFLKIIPLPVWGGKCWKLV